MSLDRFPVADSVSLPKTAVEDTFPLGMSPVEAFGQDLSQFGDKEILPRAGDRALENAIRNQTCRLCLDGVEFLRKSADLRKKEQTASRDFLLLASYRFLLGSDADIDPVEETRR